MQSRSRGGRWVFRKEQWAWKASCRKDKWRSVSLRQPVEAIEMLPGGRISGEANLAGKVLSLLLKEPERIGKMCLWKAEERKKGGGDAGIPGG